MLGILLACYKFKNLQKTNSKLVAILWGILYFFFSIALDLLLVLMIAMSEFIIPNSYIALAILQVSPFIILPLGIVSALIFVNKKLIID